MSSLRHQVAIIGVAETRYERRSDRIEWSLALDAARGAAADAGIDVRDIDGIVRYSQDRVSEADLSTAFGLRLRYHGQVGFGGQSACAVIGQAAAAIHAGLAETVLCYRALNGRAGPRYGQSDRLFQTDDHGNRRAHGNRAPGGEFSAPYALLTPGQVMALWARRYAHEAGISIARLQQALARIAIDQRRYANRNPRAVMHRKPLDEETYQQGRLIADPLRLYDFCLETDGAAAVILTTADRARSIRDDACFVLGATQSLQEEAMEVYSELVNGPDHRALAQRLYAEAGITADDVDVAMLYDANTIMVLLQLEGYGLVPPNEAAGWLIDHGIGLDSPMPVNTSGGQLSESYVHGMNLVVEAVRQLRGASTSNVRDAEVALVGAAGASSLVLAR